MKIKKDKVIMEFSKYNDLIDRINNLNDILITYKHEIKVLNKKLRAEKNKIL